MIYQCSTGSTPLGDSLLDGYPEYNILQPLRTYRYFIVQKANVTSPALKQTSCLSILQEHVKLDTQTFLSSYPPFFFQCG